MDAQILKEIKEVRQLLSKMIGTTDLPAKQQFSTQALDKAAEEFKTLSIQHGEWISDVSKIIKGAPYGSGKFIVKISDSITILSGVKQGILTEKI